MTRFALDRRLDRLARDLRMLGFDSFHKEAASSAELLESVQAEGRVLLTQDQGLHDSAPSGLRYLVQETGQREQLREVLKRFSLVEAARTEKGFLSRCLQCNSPLLPAHPHQVAHLVSGDILTSFDHFYFCTRCERVHWKSSHWERMKKWTQDVLKD